MSDELKPAEKLKALGLKSTSSQTNPLSDEFSSLETAVNNLSNGFSEFQNDIDSKSSFQEVEDYLNNTLGLSSSTATILRNKFESRYADLSSFQNDLNSFSTFTAWENSFTWGQTIASETTTDGTTRNSGVRFHSEGGVTRNNVRVPAGTVEIFGPEVHITQTGTTADENPDKNTVLSWSNMSASDTTLDPLQSVTFTADVTNNGSYPEDHTPTLNVDEETVKTGTVFTIASGDTETVSFTYSFSEVGVYDVAISSSSTIQVSVTPPGLT